MDTIRRAYQQMCRAMPGGWATMAASLEQLRRNICSQVTRMLQLSMQVFTTQQQEPKQ